MMKYAYMRKKAIIEAVISVVAIAIAGGGAMYAVGLSETVVEEKSRIESTIRSTESEINSYKAQLGKSDESLARYLEMIELRGDGLTFYVNRPQAARILQGMIEKYRLQVTSSEIGPLEPVDNQAFNGINMDIERSTIQMEFEAMTDQHVYSFVEEFSLRFPGFIKVHSFDISRERELTSNTLFQVHSGGTPLLVKASFSADWLVLKPKPEANEDRSDRDEVAAQGGF